MKTKTFSLRVVLTVVTGRLLTVPKDGDNGIGELNELLDHMTNARLVSPQLPRAGRECKPWLLRWFPELKPVEACIAKLDEWLNKAEGCSDEAVKMWLTELKMMFPDLKYDYAVEQIPMDDHDVLDVCEEIAKIRGTDEGIIVFRLDEGVEI